MTNYTIREIRMKLHNTNEDVVKEELVVSKIRERYSANEENSLLRKSIAKSDYKDEFRIYNLYVEQCIREVKDLINEAKGLNAPDPLTQEKL